MPALTRRETSARLRRFRQRRAMVGALIVAALASGIGIAAAAAERGQGDASGQAPDGPAAGVTALPIPQQLGSTPASAPPSAPEPESEAPVCDDADVGAALNGGTDADVIAAVGGGEAFRAAVASGQAPCLDLTDPRRVWVVVGKQSPLQPLDFAPAETKAPEMTATSSRLRLRPEAADALTQLVSTAAAEGVGQIGLNSAYRPYESQVRINGQYVRQLGQDAADLTSARPGYSEHQTGLAADVVACSPGCGTLEAFGATAQSDWVAENAWRFGYIVRYEQGTDGTTGYEWEPWHLRYVGTDLAAAYRDGGFRTLEEFFGLPAAPHYH